MIIFKENIFHSKRDIKYVFEESSCNSKYLLITFSAFEPINTPPHYSYISIFKNINFNRLFILDEYGPRGCFYLGENSKFDVEFSVYELIKYILNTYNISSKNVICCGSSKGGYCALYFSIKYNLGYAIVGAPVILIGTYLAYECENTLSIVNFITGGISKENVHSLDCLLIDIIKYNSHFPDIYIHAGEKDYIYVNHVTKLLSIFNKKNISYELDLKNYSRHDDTGIYYPPYLKKVVSDIVLKN